MNSCYNSTGKKCQGLIMARRKNTYQKKLDYNNNYNRENYRSFSIRYSRVNEKDMIEWLESKKSIKAYVTSLIRKDMENNG